MYGARAAPSLSAAPSLEPSAVPSVEPSAVPSLTPAEQAAEQAGAAYVGWMRFQDATLQDPPPIAGEGAEAEAALEQFLADSQQYGFDVVEGELIAAVDQYLERGWRQVGGSELTGVTAVSVDLEPEEGRPTAVMRACWVPDWGVVGEDGAPAPELEDVEVTSSVLEARVELVQEEGFDGWYVRSLEDIEEESC